MRLATPIALLLAGTLVVGLGCRQKKAPTPGPTTPPGQQTLYERLGGEKSIRAVVHSFVQKGAQNPDVNFTRQGRPNEWEVTEKSAAQLEQRLFEFISSQTGGPHKYTGRDMPTSHAGMQITSVEFDALTADLKTTLDEYGVAQKEQEELLEIVAATKEDIVGK